MNSFFGACALWKAVLLAASCLAFETSDVFKLDATGFVLVDAVGADGFADPGLNDFAGGVTGFELVGGFAEGADGFELPDEKDFGGDEGRLELLDDGRLLLELDGRDELPDENDRDEDDELLERLLLELDDDRPLLDDELPPFGSATVVHKSTAKTATRAVYLFI